METQLSKIAREYVLWTSLDYSVKGRVIEVLNVDGRGTHFEWEVSHYYKPSAGAAAPYYPSARTGRTVEEAEALLLSYIRGFTGIGVEKNTKY